MRPKEDRVQTIVDEIYERLGEKPSDIEYIRDRAILTPLNEYVETVNNEVLQKLPGELKVYRIYDNISQGSTNVVAEEILYPPEYLNSLKFSDLPNHELKIKVCEPIMLLRNLNRKKGLCNGTRLIVTRCYQFLIEAQIITGNKIGEITLIPRISISSSDNTFPTPLKRKQLPVSVCYAVTINKS